ncbi:hypothetical protein C7I87_02640 [Mesorhizobium sp. SARCC-RB16n]|uniref:hypothetical protein n=1 Tax=Mesorhizobium sp. SARCC-RB16n TaxID=2116687 RepID=UPI00122F9FF4|nr:hypothetical protein [Mesorhizobium sp. SARCC-RB16n]KAA3452297.1 hypothetical protein C7I87_02640 [Mesorhizobium sp. SARCC-RB16n]
MEEIGKTQQKAIARLIPEWISSDASRRQLRQLLDLPTDADMPRQHRSLLDELDRRLDELACTKTNPTGTLSGRVYSRTVTRRKL